MAEDGLLAGGSRFWTQVPDFGRSIYAALGFAVVLFSLIGLWTTRAQIMGRAEVANEWAALAGLRRAVLQYRDRPPPRQFLGVVHLAQVQHVPLHHPSPGDPGVLDNAPVAALFAILPANFAAQEHEGRQLSAHWRP